MTCVYRILYRPGNNAADYKVHTGRKGTCLYLTLGAARSAVTQFRSMDRYYGGGAIEYKIQSALVGEWEDDNA